MKNYFKMGMLLIVLFTAFFCLSSCQDKVTIESIEVDTETIDDEIVLDEFDLSNIMLIVTKSDGSSERVSLNSSMFTQEDLEKLCTTGTHTVNVNYLGKNANFTITIEESYLVVQLKNIHTMAVQSGLVEETYEDWLETIKGEDGLSIISATINQDGHLILTLSDNQTIDAGLVDAKEVQIQVEDGYIQWKYEDETDWNNLISLSILEGEKGEDGKEVELQVTNDYIQWKYTNDTDWNNLIELSDLQGENGKEIVLQVEEGYIQWKYEGDSTWTNLIELTTLTGPQGEAGVDGKEVTFQVSEGYIQWKYVEDTTWTNLIELTTLTGPQGEAGVDGKEVTFQVSEGYIQWKYVEDTTWTNLIDLATLTGPQGEAGVDGKEVIFQVSEGYIQWKYDGDTTWINLIELTTLTGPRGEAGVDGKEVTFQVSEGYIQWQYVGDITWTNLISLDYISGSNGESAYEIYKQYHPEYTGTEEEWIADLVNGRLVDKENVTIVLDPVNGVLPQGTDDTYIIEKGSYIDLPIPTKEGYTFIGWYTGTTVNDGHFTNDMQVLSDINLYAKWELNQYVVNFLDNNGKLLSKQIIEHGNSAQEPFYPVIKGYTFIEWDKSFEVVTSDLNIMATYEANDYTITYIIDDSNQIQTTVEYDELIEYVPDIKPGYTFEGWKYDDQTITESFIYQFDKDIVLEAVWQIDEFDYLVQDNEVKIIGYRGNNVNIIIPNTIDRYPVTVIGEAIFHLDTNIISVYVSSNVRIIEDGAFAFTSLEEVVFANNSQLTEIGYGAFYFSKINTVLIPSSVTKIHPTAFVSENLTEILVEENNNNYVSVDGILFDIEMTKIVQYPTAKAGSSYTIPSEIIEICPDAFSDSIYLENIYFEEGSQLETIGDSAFSYTGLTSITIPSSVTTIGNFAFGYNSELIEVFVERDIVGDLTIIAEGVFENSNSQLKIYVPENCIDDYKTMDYWSMYSDIIFKNTYYTVEFVDYDGTVLSTQEVLHSNEATAPIVNPMRMGYTFTNWDKVFSFIESDLVVRAVYSANQYSITFNSNGGSLVDAMNVYYDSLVNLPIPVKTGYTFEGWQYGEAIIRAPFETIYTYPGNIEITAIWQEDIFTYSIENNEVTITDYNGIYIYDLILPNTIEGYPVTIIVEGALCSTDVTSLFIPSNVYSFGRSYIPRLNAVQVDENNAYYSSVNGVLFNKEQTTIIYYPVAKTDISYTIPEGVISIGEEAFRESLIETIYFPSSVKELRREAFYASRLMVINFAPNSQLETIGEEAFSSIYDVETITIPKSVKTIGFKAFYVSPLQEIIFEEGSLLETIGESAFENSRDLTSIFIPDKVSSIGKNAFKGLEALTEIVVDANNQYYSSLDGVLYNKDRSVLIQYPIGKVNTTFTLPNTAIEIGDFAFERANNLTEVILNEGLQIIGEGAFSFSSLESVTIPSSVVQIEMVAFECANNLTEVILNEGLQTIGDFAFVNTSLVSITIPSSVTVIMPGAFYRSTLTEVNFAEGSQLETIQAATFEAANLKTITIPYSVKYIEEYAFYDNVNLNTVFVERDIVGDETMLSDYNFSSSSVEIYVPNNCLNNYQTMINWKNHTIYPHVYYIVEFVDYDGTVINTQEVLHSNEAIAPTPPTRTGYTFTGWAEAFNVIESDLVVTAVYSANPYTITFNSNGGSLVDAMVVNYDSLVNLPIPVKTNYTFEGWQYGEDIIRAPFDMTYTYPANIEFTAIWQETTEFSYEIINNEITINSYNGSNSDITIPNTIEGYLVTNIDVEALNKNFLVNIYVDSNNNYFSSIDGVLFNKDQTVLIKFPQFKSVDFFYGIPNGVETIGQYAFSGVNYSLPVEIPSSVTTIEDYAFYKNQILQITIPNSVEVIGDYAFLDSYISSFNIPSSVTSIGIQALASSKVSTVTVDANNQYYSASDGVLYNKDQTILIMYPYQKTGSSFTVPNTVTTIAPLAFADNYCLMNVIIPETVTEIEDEAFINPNVLQSVTIERTALLGITILGTDVFMSDSVNPLIYVPSDSVDTYKNASNWNNYTDYIYPIG